MATLQPASPDPLVPIEDEPSPDIDYAAHIRMFNAVFNTAEWFVAHVLILLVALYYMMIAHQPGTGIFFLICALALLAYAILRRPSVRADLSKGLGAGPGVPATQAVDHSPSLGERT